jgi:CheY-like chemotaxis protein
VPPRIAKLLDIEDSMVPRRILAEQLAAVKEYSFAVTCVASEDEALEVFRRGGIDCVVLDYHLAQGDGLSCLRKLRQLDAIVPIIAVSGEATPEIAAELLRVGADDYISKNELKSGAVPRSLCTALARADALRRFGSANGPASKGRTGALFEEISKTFLARVGPAFLDRLDEWERAARQESWTVAQVERWFETTCSELAAVDSAGSASLERLLRPLLLEMLLRLHDG